MAQRTVSAFKSTKNSRFADNTTGLISEADSRDMYEDVADSFLNITDHFIDEDSFASNSATKVPSQQSVKAYVDAQVSGGASDGTYTPTLTNTTNITSSTPQTLYYTRIGDVVHVAGVIQIQTAAAAATELRISLPIPSDFANVHECSGVMSNAVVHGYIQGNVANNVASLNFTANGALTVSYYINFTYRVI